jgi:hypothetical protein
MNDMLTPFTCEDRVACMACLRNKPLNVQWCAPSSVSSDARRSRIVFIGRNLNRPRLRRGFESCVSDLTPTGEWQPA